MRRRGRRKPMSRGLGGATYARRTKSFVQPSLLLLLRRGDGHGYALMEGLKDMGLADDSLNPSVVYRGLREMEDWGWVTSHWETEGAGPPRRVYRITGEGEVYLQDWARDLGEMRKTLDRFVEAYSGDSQKDGRPS
jgi:PadR family transcriptional regulator PadR